VRGFLAGRTRVLVTHQLQFVRHADHVVVMRDGRVAEQGAYEDLVRREGGQLREMMEECGGKEEETIQRATVRRPRILSRGRRWCGGPRCPDWSSSDDLFDGAFAKTRFSLTLRQGGGCTPAQARELSLSHRSVLLSGQQHFSMLLHITKKQLENMRSYACLSLFGCWTERGKDHVHTARGPFTTPVSINHLSSSNQ
jgi:ABC-type glutathione transport system ATPase component